MEGFIKNTADRKKGQKWRVETPFPSGWEQRNMMEMYHGF
jgi:hypothetical protein